VSEKGEEGSGQVSNNPETLEDFEKIDIRVGICTEAAPFTGVQYSTQIPTIDFGQQFGVKMSLARLDSNDDGPEIVGRQVLSVVKFWLGQVGKHFSGVPMLGFPDGQRDVVLINPDREVSVGGSL
jgi:tRNA-binding protein